MSKTMKLLDKLMNEGGGISFSLIFVIIFILTILYFLK